MVFRGYTMEDTKNPKNFAWPAILTGLAMCFAVACWVLHKFHRWP